MLSLSIAWHVFFFIFIFHLIELPGLLESWWTYKGLIYYKDFATFHFPLGRWILLPFYILTNWNLQTGPTLGLITNITSVTLIYKFGQKYFNKIGTTISIIFFSLFSWYLETGIMFYHEMLVGLLLLITFFYFSNKYSLGTVKPASAFLLGFLISITELSGQIVTPTLVAFSAIFLVKNPRKILLFLLGSGTPLALLSLYFLTKNAFGEFFKQNFLYYTTYADAYQKVPLLSLPLFELFLFYFPLFISIFTIIYLKFVNVKVNFLFLSSNLLLLSTIPFTIFSVFHFHHLSFALPITSISAGFLFSEIFKNKSTKHFAKLLAILFLLLLSIKLLPWYINSSKLSNIGRIANNLTVGDTMSQTVEWIKENTTSDSTILVAGDTLFYFSANRKPSNKNAYVSPYNWEPLDKTRQDVNQKPPDYWIINRTYFARLIKDYEKQSMVDYIEKSLQDNYSQEAIFDDWEVWKRRAN